MQITVCTIGFAGKTAEEFFRLLKDAGVQRVLDIREHRVGQLSGFAKYPDIEFFLERIGGIAYVYEPLLAPSPEIRKAYRKNHDWLQYEAAFLELMVQRGVPKKLEPASFEGAIALLCSEPGPEKCHRRLVADLLAQHWDSRGHATVVRHLVADKPTRKTGKMRSVSR